ncbi:MAG: septum formation initiator family protein [Tannerellaceae bacterium]|jgi:cell division protein FtsB|nr:septum formation initiator family protein [Tannerellaceae bacterium]
MNRIKDFFKICWPKLNAYWVVAILFAVFTFCLGDGNLYKRYKYDEAIRNLSKEIELYDKEIKENLQKLEDIRMDKENLERFAREEYLMKKTNEDVFIIK